MRVFKTTYKDRKGRTKEAAAWYVEFRDHLDTVRRLPAFPSKAASEEMGRNLEKLVAYHKASGGQTDPALTRFLAGLPAKTRERLVVLGLLAPERVAIGKRLADHLDDFGKALTGKGNTPFHVEVITKRAPARHRGVRVPVLRRPISQQGAGVLAPAAAGHRGRARHLCPDIQLLPSGRQAILSLDGTGPAGIRPAPGPS